MADYRYVPETVGPLLQSRRDQKDQLLDEMFGPADEGGPGAFDAALIAVGAGLLLWGVIAGIGLLDVLGGIALLLGLVLPARALLRRRRRRRVPGRPLDVSDPLIARFAAAYDAIFRSDNPARVIVTPVTHLAAVEVATLLAGAPPGGPAQRAYVGERVELLETVGCQLSDHSGALGLTSASMDKREAEALGRLELESSTQSSVHALRRLTQGESADDGPAG